MSKSSQMYLIGAQIDPEKKQKPLSAPQVFVGRHELLEGVHIQNFQKPKM